jgi:hypothetical protein
MMGKLELPRGTAIGLCGSVFYRQKMGEFSQGRVSPSPAGGANMDRIGTGKSSIRIAAWAW